MIFDKKYDKDPKINPSTFGKKGENKYQTFAM